ncbi:MAG: glycosyltransferase family 2 protein [Bradyrhizobium sp.]|uniref:glycosyltransferase family 2 protein n=1 Tax=Bradyrhizobium sp. TaxID=376 RepID=UPI001C29D4AC|nr:glycosyltransferase [Bradyrhizobium sp.]MBU6461940.1 glycosyltransferase [Pseudomonadota bacterium]MDE2066917.1 glycosyltransferase family 2 protein [Bradyrhizobium sp.]MDE2473327.1 glycosyltransferase family 2 protein [Bradyrhizobium sp.]
MEFSDDMAAAARSLATISCDLDLTVTVVVCIPTFRRPQHLRRTLQSLADQQTHCRFAVVVIENDAMKCEGAPVAAEFLHGGRLQGLCVVEPRQGNCRAINAAFQTALATFPAAIHLLMIDDDEVASPYWLERMVSAAEATGADVIGGPVLPNFDDDSKRALRRHPAFCPAYDASGPVPTIYGCGNCLIKRAVFERLDDPAFDLRFNFLGGGDTDFFARCRQAGMKFHWTADAIITETVPPSRTNPGWLALRGLRIGAINYHVEFKAARTLPTRIKLLARLLGRLPLSLMRAIRLIITEQKPIFALHPMAVALGSALASLGIEPQPYKASKITP